jgi:nucleoside-diphosphate-sugar epimerase
MHFVVVGVGYTGKRVCTLLRSDRVYLVNRSELNENLQEFPNHTVDLDSSSLEALTLPAPCTVLYTVPPESYENARLENFLRNLSSEVHRIVYLSTTGVYGDHGGAVVTEDNAPKPTTNRAQYRLAAENRLLEWGSEKSAEIMVLRVPGIYGPDRLGVSRLAANDAVIREVDANPGNRIHVDDLTACCIAAMTLDAPTGVYNVGDGDYRSSTWFAKTVARLAGMSAPREIAREDALRNFSSRRLSFLAESRQIDISKMRDTLGCVPRYRDAEDGIRASL